MKRKITDALLSWKNSATRMPLVINGARQVGKTYIVEKFGNEYYSDILYVNMEIESNFAKFLDSDLSPHKVIQYLEASKSRKIIPGETLIFIDEIQACERALTLLKYFCEQQPEQHIIAAGSLLGVAINREKYSFPVGKVDELNMYPLDFEEFLWAIGKKILTNEIRFHYDSNEPMNDAMHELAIEAYNQYLIVGGMPAVVGAFVETGSYIEVQKRQNNILNEYIIDMAKYADASTSVKIRACYDSIPAQLAKDNTKFQYKVVQKGGTATIFGEAIEWIVFAGIGLKCRRLEHGNIPLTAYMDLSSFKLYMADIGLLVMHSKMPLQMILSPIEIDNTFLGSIAENYVAQVLTNKGYDLMYWQSDGKAEVDFIIQSEDGILPIEVKKGKRTRSRSLSVFRDIYKPPYSIRISKKNFGFDNQIKSIPLYATFCL